MILCIAITLTGSDKPTLKDFNNMIRDQVATQWYALGVQLLPNHHPLDIIKANKSTDVVACSTEMFNYWLQVDTTASWSKLIEALREINKHELAESISKKVLQGNSISV